MSGGVSRVKDHLVRIVGNVMPCKEVLSKLRKFILAQLCLKKRKKSSKNNEGKLQGKLLNTPVPLNFDTDDEDEEIRGMRRAM